MFEIAMIGEACRDYVGLHRIPLADTEEILELRTTGWPIGLL
jgi:hypothetical protein